MSHYLAIGDIEVASMGARPSSQARATHFQFAPEFICPLLRHRTDNQVLPAMPGTDPKLFRGDSVRRISAKNLPHGRGSTPTPINSSALARLLDEEHQKGRLERMSACEPAPGIRNDEDDAQKAPRVDRRRSRHGHG